MMISRDSFKQADSHRFIDGFPAAGSFAGGGADASQHGGQGDIPDHDIIGLPEFASCQMPVHQRDIHVGWTGALAGGFAIPDMVAEQQVESGFTCLSYLLISSDDLHALFCPDGAARDHFAVTLILYHTDHTGGKVGQVAVMAH